MSKPKRKGVKRKRRCIDQKTNNNQVLEQYDFLMKEIDNIDENIYHLNKELTDLGERRGKIKEEITKLLQNGFQERKNNHKKGKIVDKMVSMLCTKGYYHYEIWKIGTK